MTKRETRSNRYQYKILETPCSHEFLSAFSTTQSISHHLDPFKYDERVANILENIRIEFWNIVENSMTEHQQKVLRMVADGYTQKEISEIIGCTQGDVSKCLRGVLVRGSKKKTHLGGCYNKLKDLVAQNEHIQALLLELSEVQEEKW